MHCLPEGSILLQVFRIQAYREADEMKLSSSMRRWLGRKRGARVLRVATVLLSLWAVVQGGPASGSARMNCGRGFVRAHVACQRCERQQRPAPTPASRPCCRVSAAMPTAAVAQSASNDAGRNDARHMALATLPVFANGCVASVLLAPPIASTSGPPLALAAIGTTLLRL
jgi:hypothetical protein